MLTLPEKLTFDRLLPMLFWLLLILALRGSLKPVNKRQSAREKSAKSGFEEASIKCFEF
jgi:hypothetical protein